VQFYEQPITAHGRSALGKESGFIVAQATIERMNI